MKINHFALFLLLSPLFIYSQDKERVLHEFKTTNNDSLFISQNSIFPYKVNILNKMTNYDSTNYTIKQILNANTGDILGPFDSDSALNYIKITEVKTAHKVRVGNIWINIEKGHNEAEAIANRILSEIKNGKNYNALCHLYSDDKNNKKDCDLGWFFNTMMVEPFASEIIKHKKDEVFVVETIYGFHIVKMLGDPYLDKMKIKYTILSLRK